MKAATKIKISYAAVPAAVTATTDSFDVGLEVMDAVVNYVAMDRPDTQTSVSHAVPPRGASAEE